MKLRLISLLLVGLPWVGWAQTNNSTWEDPGDIEDAEIVIEKKREIELPAANRQYDKVPPLPLPPAPTALQYSFQNFTYDLTPLSPRVRPLTLADEPLSKLYGNYVKAGFGNYITPYLSAQLGNKRNPDAAWTAHLMHQSSVSGAVDSANSGSANSHIGLSTRSMGQRATLRTTLHYDRQRIHYYGYPMGEVHIRDSIRQVYHRFGAEVAIRPNGERQTADYAVDANYHFQTDRFGAREQIGGIRGHINMDINEDFTARLSGGGWISQRSDITEQLRYFVKLQPTVGYAKGALRVQAGINLVFDNDSLANTNATYLYPLIEARYTVADALIPYAKIWGDVEMVTWHKLSTDNPWIARESALYNTLIPIEVIVGARGALGEIGFYDVGAKMGTLRNAHFFVPSGNDDGRFAVQYEQNRTTRFNAFGELTARGGEVFRGSLRADYWFYQRRDALGEPSTTLYAWHRPQVQLTALTQLTLADKFMLNVKAAIMGGILVPGETEALPPIYDVGVKAEYRITPRLGVFGDFSNVLNQNWVRYQQYPSRALLAIGGISYAF